MIDAKSTSFFAQRLCHTLDIELCFSSKQFVDALNDVLLRLSLFQHVDGRGVSGLFGGSRGC